MYYKYTKIHVNVSLLLLKIAYELILVEENNQNFERRKSEYKDQAKSISNSIQLTDGKEY